MQDNPYKWQEGNKTQELGVSYALYHRPLWDMRLKPTVNNRTTLYYNTFVTFWLCFNNNTLKTIIVRAKKENFSFYKTVAHKFRFFPSHAVALPNARGHIFFYRKYWQYLPA